MVGGYMMNLSDAMYSRKQKLETFITTWTVKNSKYDNEWIYVRLQKTRKKEK